MADLDQIGKLLILLGALIGLVQGVLLVLGTPFGFAYFDFGLGTLVMGVLVILRWIGSLMVKGG